MRVVLDTEKILYEPISGMGEDVQTQRIKQVKSLLYLLDTKKVLFEVVWMEDDVQNQSTTKIRSLLEREGECKVNIVTSLEEVTSIAKNNQIFILDINMGKGRDQEGLDALEIIKKNNPNAFVCMFSAYSEHEKYARNLGCDLYIRKTEKVRENVYKIMSEILKYKLRQLAKINNDMLYPEDFDPNIRAYQENIKIPEWLERYEGQYVAFLDGNLVDSDPDKHILLDRLSKNFPNQSCLCKQVIKKNRIVDIPYFEIV